MTTRIRKAMYRLLASIILVTVLSFTFSSCSGGGGESGTTTERTPTGGDGLTSSGTPTGGGAGDGLVPYGTPFIYAQLESFPTASAPPGFNNSTASVSIVDSNNGDAITNALVTLNGTPLQYKSDNKEYEGTAVVLPGDPVTLSVLVSGTRYTASTTQFSQYPAITSPAPYAMWSVADFNTITWTAGSPITNAYYGLGLLDAGSGDLVWPAYGYLQHVPTDYPTYTISPHSLTKGRRLIIVGIVHEVPISDAAAGSVLVTAGFDYVPVTLPPGIQALPGSGQVTLSWDTVESATSYDIYWSTNPDVKSTGTKIENVTSPYAHAGLTNGSTYYYYVAAKGNTRGIVESITIHATPAAVTSIAGGTANTVVLKDRGTAWGWGGYLPGLPENSNSHYASSTPIPLCSTAGVSSGTCGSYLTSVAAVAGGDSYTIALKNNGTVWTWGKDYDGNLGNNDSSNITYFPVQVCASAGASVGTCASYLTGITAIEGSGEDGWMQSTIALRNDGTVWTWGNNMFGQLGNNSTVSSTVPVQVCATAGASSGTCGSFLTGVTAVSAGEDGFNVALKNDGSVWAWGNNTYSQLGNNYRSTSLIPVQVCATAGASWGTCSSYLSGITAIEAGAHHVIALKSDGTVWTWGGNDCGDLGHNNTGMFGSGESPIPIQVCATAGASEDTCGSYLAGVTAVTAGTGLTGALKNDGTVWTWGCNSYYAQLGNNSTVSSPIPVQVCATAGATAGTCGSFLDGITALSGKFNRPVALKNDGTVWEWGKIAVQSNVAGPGSVLAPSDVNAGGPGSATINISWSASPGASSYNLYWSTQSNISPLTGTRIPLGNVTNYAHSGRTAGTRYYYVVTAVDSIGNESPGSRVVTSVAQ